MAEIAIGILGLGRLGTSVALALKRYNSSGSEHTFTITGFDSINKNLNAAKKRDALHKAVNRAEMAVQGMDIVVMALPYAEVKATYEYIGPDLRSGAVVLDMSPLGQNNLQWAAQHLADGAHIVSIKPVVNPAYLFEGIDDTDRASEDFFDNGTFMLMPGVNAVKAAIDLATDFTRILGAEKQFIDAAENDGLTAGAEIMPALLGAAFFQTMSTKPGWQDLQRHTNTDFGMLTHALFDTHPDDLRDLFLGGGDNLARHLDDFIETLREFRTAIASGDSAAIESALVAASKEYEAWYNRRYNNKWGDVGQVDTSGASVSNLMGQWLGIGRRRKSDDD